MPVTKPQHEVLLRRGPLAGQAVWVDYDADVIVIDGHRYINDLALADYFVYDAEEEQL